VERKKGNLMQVLIIDSRMRNASVHTDEEENARLMNRKTFSSMASTRPKNSTASHSMTVK
jgi:hypothetical protein